MKIMNKLSVLSVLLLVLYTGCVLAEESTDETSSDFGDLIENILLMANIIKYVQQFAVYAAKVGLLPAIGTALVIILISILIAKMCGPCLEESNKKKYQPVRIGALGWNLFRN